MSQENPQLKEIWKPVINYEGKYEVSSLGNVASLNYRMTGKRRLLTLLNHPDGYSGVVLCSAYKTKRILVHRLVAQAFIPNHDNLPQVDHINGKRYDNNVNNLRWSTQKDNMNFSLARANKSKVMMGENNPSYDPNSLRQIHKRASDAREFSKTVFTFRNAYKNPNHKDHQMVLELIKKHII